MTKTIDIHTHVLADATVALMQKEILSLGLKMAPFDNDNAVCEVAGVAYRPFPRGGHDIERRFKDMDAAEVDVHLLSAAPQTWLYNQDAAVGIAGATIQNNEIARLVKEHPERFSGIATLPMQAPDKAAEELRRAMRKLGLHGAMMAPTSTGGIRRSEFRDAVDGGRRARRLHDDPSRQCRRRRSAALLLSRQSDR